MYSKFYYFGYTYSEQVGKPVELDYELGINSCAI